MLARTQSPADSANNIPRLLAIARAPVRLGNGLTVTGYRFSIFCVCAVGILGLAATTFILSNFFASAFHSQRRITTKAGGSQNQRHD